MGSKMYIADKETLDVVHQDTQEIKEVIERAKIGGIPPVAGKLRVYPSNGSVKIYMTPPDDTVIDDQELCRVGGVMIRRSTDTYPTSPDEGDLVLNLTRDEMDRYSVSAYIDSGLVNDTTYYYAAFSYSDHGVYNLSDTTRKKAKPSTYAKVTVTFTAKEAVGCTITAKRGATAISEKVGEDQKATIELTSVGTWKVGGVKVQVEDMGEEIAITEDIYGYTWDIGESDPESAIDYPEGVTNDGFSGVPVCGADAAISLGDWKDFFDNFVKARPVMLNFDGTVAAELNHDDQTKNIDGTTSDVSNTAKTMNAMVEFPKRYFKRYTDSEGKFQFRASQMKLEDNYKCFNWLYGDTEESAFENDFIYLPMFEGSSVSSKVRSIAGQTPMNTQTGATEWTQIQALGEGWIFDDWADEVMITDYMFMMGKSTNVQTHWGNGHYSGGSSASNLLATGGLKDKGAFYGGTGNSYMKFMWLENYFGDRWTRSFGVWYINSVLYIKMFPPYTTDGDVTNYKNLGRGIGGTSGGYISDATYDENGMVPKTASGSETTYWPDGCWFASGTMFLLWGGCCYNGLRVGAAFYVYDPFSLSNWGFGPSPAYKCPKAA
jgi:hypothetical protein